MYSRENPPINQEVMSKASESCLRISEKDQNLGDVMAAFEKLSLSDPEGCKLLMETYFNNLPTEHDN